MELTEAELQARLDAFTPPEQKLTGVLKMFVGQRKERMRAKDKGVCTENRRAHALFWFALTSLSGHASRPTSSTCTILTPTRVYL